MRKLALSALVALGFGLFVSAAASAAPVSAGASGLGTAAISASLIEDVAVTCRRIRTCRPTPRGEVCRTERVCREFGPPVVVVPPPVSTCRNIRVCRDTPRGRICRVERVCRRVW